MFYFLASAIAAKVYNTLLLNRIRPKVGKVLWKNQKSIQRNRPRTSQTLIIRQTIKEGRAKKNNDDHLFPLFPDLGSMPNYKFDSFMRK